MFKLFIIGIVIFCFIQACGNRSETVITEQGTNTIDTINIGCLGSYEINVLGNGETINRLYGKERIKQGHWINFEFIIPTGKQSFEANENKNKKVARTKLEEGYYRHNKKEGFWKSYNKYGTLKDSLQYKNDIAVIN